MTTNNHEIIINGIIAACMMADIGSAATLAGADHILRVLEREVGYCTKELREDLGLEFGHDGATGVDSDESVHPDVVEDMAGHAADRVTIDAGRMHINAEMSTCGGAGEACSDYTPQQLKMASELLLDMISKNIADKKI